MSTITDQHSLNRLALLDEKAHIEDDLIEINAEHDWLEERLGQIDHQLIGDGTAQ